MAGDKIKFKKGALPSGIVVDSDLYLYQRGVKINSSAAEINEVADKSAKAVISITDDIALTQALHANKILIANKAAGIAFTLPEATGTGDLYTIIIGTAMTSGSLTVTAADTTNGDMVGSVLMIDLDAATTAYIAQTIQATGDDIFTMNRTTTGGVNVGVDWVTFRDIGTDLWLVDGVLYVPTGSNPATPFSGT